MANLQPTVLENIGLGDFIQHILDSHGSASTLVVCSSKEVFLRQLQKVLIGSLQTQHVERPTDPSNAEREPTVTEEAGTTPPIRSHSWTIPTLRLLTSAQTLTLAFCEDVTHLRAFLAAYPYTNPPRDLAPSTSASRMLAILDPITLHRSTSNFSAQGLNRTFAIAVDAAHASGSKLVLAECSSQPPSDRDEETDSDAVPTRAELRDVWDEEVSIMNVATKMFGAGERGWVGRTVKLRTIASRWCVFERKPGISGPQA